VEVDVETAIELLLDQGLLPRAKEVQDLVRPEPCAVPAMPAPVVDLQAYDRLLEEWKEVG
jgi:hypothetical protein